MLDRSGFLSPSAGEVDVQMLTELQSELPGVPIRAEIVEGSVTLTGYFRGSERQSPSNRGEPHLLVLRLRWVNYRSSRVHGAEDLAWSISASAVVARLSRDFISRD